MTAVSVPARPASSLNFMGLVSLFALVTGCSDGGPIAAEKSRVVSPDRKSVAVVEGVDNGLGFGQGMYYDEIHVGPAELVTTDHGDPSSSVVFYAAQLDNTDEPPAVQWLDPQHLMVTYDGARKPQELLPSVGGIKIEYRPRAKP